MKSLNLSVLGIALLSLVGGAGCGGSAEDKTAGLEPLGTSQAALETQFGWWSETSNGASTTPLSWAPSEPVTGNSTCWLSGVYGGLNGPVTGTTGGALAAVQLNNGNQWEITINPGRGTGLRVDVTCVNRHTNRNESLAWTNYNNGFGQPPGPNGLAAASAETQCYLQNIWAMSGLIGSYNGSGTGAWLSFNPSVGTYGTWLLGGNAFPQEDFRAGLNVQAVCVDIPNTWTGTGSWGQGTGGGLIEGTLITNGGAAVECGMTAFEGDFAAADITVNNQDGAGAVFNSPNWDVFADSAAGGAHGGMSANYGCVTMQ